jgi:CheY-like chemotaxis protein
MGQGFLIFEPANPTNQERRTDPIRVLLVEDDEDYREIVGSELSWHGFAACSFADGASLLGLLDTAAEADVIVLDWRLPNISGIDLLPQLRQRSVNLPVVFLTSHLTGVRETRLRSRCARLHRQDTRRGGSRQASQTRGQIRQASRRSRGREAHRLRQARSQSAY